MLEKVQYVGTVGNIIIVGIFLGLFGHLVAAMEFALILKTVCQHDDLVTIETVFLSQLPLNSPIIHFQLIILLP